MSQASTGLSDCERPNAFGLTKAAYSVNETCTLLSISRSSLYGLIDAGKLRPMKLGKKTLLGADDLTALLHSLRKQAT